MILFKRVHIRSYEVGLYFRDGEFKRPARRPVGTGCSTRCGKVRVDVVSQRDPWLAHEKLDVIVKSGALAGRAEVVDLKDYQRALVWIDGRFSHILPPGLYAYWTGVKDVRVEIVDARQGPLPARRLQGDRPLAARRAGARHLHGRAQPRGRVVPGRRVRRNAAAGRVRLLARRRRRRRWSRSTCASRRSTSPARTS